MILMQDQIEYIQKVTEMLNGLPDAPEHRYLQVRLIDQYDHTPLASWVDEFGPGAWYFDTEPPKSG